MKSLQLTRFERSTRHLESEPCLNCNTDYIGNFCPNCGQEAHTGAPTAWNFVYEFFTRNVFERGKLPRTIWHLLRYPGGLTVDFLEGRRQRFIRPVRLYIGLSVLYFLLLPFQTRELIKNLGEDGHNIAQQQLAKAEAKAKSKAQASAPTSVQKPPATPAKTPDVRIGNVLAGNDVVNANTNTSTNTNTNKKTYRDIDADTGSHKNLSETDFVVNLADKGVEGELKKRLKHFDAMTNGERSQVIARGMLNQAPKAMFFLVPVFAMLLKILFLFRRIPYGAHLLFAFNYHSVLFLCLLVFFLPLWSGVITVISMWMWLYLLFALRTTYACGWLGGVLRLFIMSALYPMAIGLAMLGTLAAAIIL